ncbi:rubrerythrin [Iocasia frigidifontis]|uniref:Rubrerythrin n=1 Tax=Iocasia fonsfrigidae TaxID=2682810 RepID=A0A8A7KCJ9_9FIRM|nr:ferritin family protein [Iocasia fonsfrigidae]QTL99516.1 rubrerythrin [Iocasia fonsfrigidae]
MLNNSVNAVEVLEMARDIEKRGRDFYLEQASNTGDKNLAALFNKLADDEKDHYERFGELLNKLQSEIKEEAVYVYEPEVSAYLRSLVEFSVFPEGDSVEIKSIETALSFAIRAEKDSILFYQELLIYNSGESAGVIKELIKEEKKHLLTLLEYRNKIK